MSIIQFKDYCVLVFCLKKNRRMKRGEIKKKYIQNFTKAQHFHGAQPYILMVFVNEMNRQILRQICHQDINLK